MTQNFNNAKIYKITNDFNDEVYIGSTCDTLIKRFSNHKGKSKVEKNINTPLYKLMNEIGVERFRIDLVENYPCNDRMSLRQREGHFIREQSTLNKNIAGREKTEYMKEYYIKHQEQIIQKGKEYRQANADKIKKYNDERKEIYQEYYIKHQEQIIQKGKEYRQANADKIKKYNDERKEIYKEYYQANADKIKEKKKRI